MRKYIVFGIVLSLLMLVSSCFALAGYLEHYTEDDGLGDNRVTLMCIGETGIKWFGSWWSGLISRFDEFCWETYRFYSAVDMAVDSSGQLWVATGCAPGIFYLDLEKDRFQPFHILDYWGFSEGYAVAFGPGGDLWMGGTGSVSVCRYRSDSLDERWASWDSDVGLPRMFAFDAEERVWFVDAYGRGVYRILDDGQTWDRIDDDIRLPSSGSDTSSHKGYYESVFASQTGRVWVQGLVDHTVVPPFYSDDYENWAMFHESPFKQSADNNLWIQCVAEEGIWFTYSVRYLNGAFYYDYQHWRFIRVPSNVTVIQVDEQTDDVWFGTNDGVYVMRGGPEAWPPVWIELEAAQLAHPDAATPSVLLLGSAEFQMDLRLDLYVALELPDGTLLFAPSWTPSMAPLVSGLEVPIGLNIEDMPLVTLDSAGVPAGTYRWYAACTHAGSMDFASNIASCEWQFE